MSFIGFQNATKYVLATLISLMLVSSFAASGLVTVKASPEFPWDGVITLHATETTNPYYGYYGGYHDVWAAIRTELAKIGINLEINYYDDFTWWDRTSSVGGWNKTWEQGGWDMYMQEWWLQPHALEPWFSSMVFSWAYPPNGYNNHPWNNSKADELLLRAMTSFDAETRKEYIWKWQELFMHDLPWIPIYYPRLFEMLPVWLNGYDPSGCWFYDVTHLSLDPSKMPAERKKLHTDWAYYAVTEDVWSLTPNYMETYTEEQMCTLEWDTLYRWSLDWDGSVTGLGPYEPATEPDPRRYIIVSELAAKDPYPFEGNWSRMRVELRQGVKWSDGDPFDADDVVWTFNVAVLDRKAGNSGRGDFTWWLDNVTKVDQYTVDFHMKMQVADIKSLLANDWGGSILPYHIYKDVGPVELKNHPSVWSFDDPSAWLPVTGPFKLKEIVPGDYLLLERNPLYFGFNESIVGSPAWGPDPSVQGMYLKWVPDPAVRLLEFQTYRLDFGEYPTAPVEVWKDMAKDPYLRVYQYNYPANNPIWVNFNNPYLSNRYIRLAIAYAIPYGKIFSEILPSWGIETAYPGKTYVLPVQYYTEPNATEIDPDLTGSKVHLFNEELEPWHYDLDKALRCMELWWYGDHGDGSLGAVGDSDLNGVVDLDDWLVWREEVPIVGTWPREVVPGNMIDPDFDNDNDVEPVDDFPLWAATYGVTYP